MSQVDRCSVEINTHQMVFNALPVASLDHAGNRKACAKHGEAGTKLVWLLQTGSMGDIQQLPSFASRRPLLIVELGDRIGMAASELHGGLLL